MSRSVLKHFQQVLGLCAGTSRETLGCLAMRETLPGVLLYIQLCKGSVETAQPGDWPRAGAREVGESSSRAELGRENLTQEVLCNLSLIEGD